MSLVHNHAAPPVGAAITQILGQRVRRHEVVPAPCFASRGGLAPPRRPFWLHLHSTACTLRVPFLQPSRNDVGASTRAGARSGSGALPLLAALRRFLAAARYLFFSTLCTPITQRKTPRSAASCRDPCRPRESRLGPKTPGARATSRPRPGKETDIYESSMAR